MIVVVVVVVVVIVSAVPVDRQLVVTRLVTDRKRRIFRRVPQRSSTPDL